MKRISRISIAVAGFIFSALFMFSCGEPCIEGNGRIVNETRVVNDFSSVVMSGDFDVFIEQSTTYEVKVEGDENLLPYVLTENRTTSTLEIRHANNRCLRSSQPVRVTIKTPNLYRVTNSGSGYVSCDYVFNDNFDVILSGSGEIDCYRLDTRDLKVTLSGSGDIKLQGKTWGSDMLISGSGTIKAYDLDQDECYVNITGSGNAYVFAFDYLNVRIPGSGSVFYRGAPDVDFRIDGSGRVVDNNK